MCAYSRRSFLGLILCFFFNDTATTEIYTLSLHDALPICAYWTFVSPAPYACVRGRNRFQSPRARASCLSSSTSGTGAHRSEEHTSELQSRQYIVCRLLLEKKK